jgi:CubicO group peptidase (beta-lactamase class C family)
LEFAIGLKFETPVKMGSALRAVMLGLVVAAAARAQLARSKEDVTPERVDSLAAKALQSFHVPGLAVAVVKDGQVVLAKGYGKRSVKTGEPVDANTLFSIASNSKAFTAMGLGLLVDEAKLKWGDTVVSIIPEFALYDPYVTSQFTVRDMLAHRSGLGMAGNLMQNLTPNEFTRADIIHGLRYLKPSASFRARFDYDNLFYIVAAEVVERKSGMAWEEFVEQRILAPLGMTRSGTSYGRIKNRANVAEGHYRAAGELRTTEQDDGESDAGAGGIYSCANDLAKWMLLLLGEGKYGAKLEAQLVRPATLKEMWTPQTIVPTGKNGQYNTHFSAYGLGWFVSDVKGYQFVSHTGEDRGMLSEVAIFPELKLGIAALANQEDTGDVPRTMVEQISDWCLGIGETDRIEENAARAHSANDAVDRAVTAVWSQVEAQRGRAGVKRDLADFAGTYHDDWFGDCAVTVEGGELWFKSEKSPQLFGRLFAYEDATFAVRWSNPRLRPADALATFSCDAQGKVVGVNLRTILPAAEFSFDFHDLDLRKTTR